MRCQTRTSLGKIPQLLQQSRKALLSRHGYCWTHQALHRVHKSDVLLEINRIFSAVYKLCYTFKSNYASKSKKSSCEAKYIEQVLGEMNFWRITDLMLIFCIRWYFIQVSSLLFTFTFSCHKQYLCSNLLVPQAYDSLKKLETRTPLSFFFLNYEPKQTEVKHQNRITEQQLYSCKISSVR